MRILRLAVQCVQTAAAAAAAVVAAAMAAHLPFEVGEGTNERGSRADKRFLLVLRDAHTDKQASRG